ncbi:MAG: peroxiredoxin [Acidobacteriia bacterium]|nr:peroxiredoxin [Terriglobia bacterium]
MLDWLLSPPLAVGTRAPDFSVPDQDGSRVTLSALRGKNVVLVFYPADDTSICTIQLCEFRDHWAEAQARNTVVFGVNPARSRAHQKFRDKYKFPFPLLIDEGQKIAKLYQADGWFVPKRTVYLVGLDGVVRYARRGKPSPEEVLAAAA